MSDVADPRGALYDEPDPRLDETHSTDGPVEGTMRSPTDAAGEVAPAPEFEEDLAYGERASYPAALFPAGESEELRARWMQIQTEFVDEPRRSVERADALVKDVTDRLVTAFARNRDDLESQWSSGDDVSTEDLRRTLQQYRSFFERLLSI